jgi:hypothetical protein
LRQQGRAGRRVPGARRSAAARSTG